MRTHAPTVLHQPTAHAYQLRLELGHSCVQQQVKVLAQVKVATLPVRLQLCDGGIPIHHLLALLLARLRHPVGGQQDPLSLPTHKRPSHRVNKQRSEPCGWSTYQVATLVIGQSCHPGLHGFS